MLQSLFSSRKTKFSEENALSQLFQANAFIFLLTSVILALKQFYFSPIDCEYEGMGGELKSYLDGYCWRNHELIVAQPLKISAMMPISMTKPIATTQGMDARSSERLVLSPKIVSTVTMTNTIKMQKKHLSHYRWLPLFLLLQCLLAYFPYWLWENSFRDKRLYDTVSFIKEPCKQHQRRRKLLIINLANDLFTEGIQRRYAKPFFFYEIMNIACLFLNVLVTNLYLQNQFILFGFNEIGMRFKSRSFTSSSGMMEQDSDLFPTFAKCSVRLAKKEQGTMKSGSGGGGIQVRKEEAVCTVTYNSLCESIFMFFWVWFCILTVASLCGICYRAAMLVSRKKRQKLLMEAVDKSFEEKLSQICDKLGFYSWFTLYRISRNVDPLTFQDIISSLLTRLDTSMPLYKSIKSSVRKKGESSSSSGDYHHQQQQVDHHQQHHLEIKGDPSPTTDTLTIKKMKGESLATIV